MIFERFGDEARETFTVNSQRAARGDTRLVRGAHDQRIQPPHFLFQKTGGILQPVRAKGVGAYELRKAIRFMGGALFARFHII